MEQENTPPQSFNQEALASDSSFCLEERDGSTPSPAVIYEESSGNLFEMQSQLMFLELQRLIEMYKDVTRKLHHTISYIDYLREENHLLSIEHLELSSLVDEKVQSSSVFFEEISPSSFFDVSRLSEKLGNVSLEAERGKDPVTGSEEDTEEGKQNSARSFLPKSISIRSNGFLATRHLSPRGGDRDSTRARHPHRLRLQAPATLQDDAGEGVVEVEAYSQGTTKTELCNKWGAMGSCPYADRCQFAHGIQELRPVIRHPRYKTQICRMLTAGNGCPYGHRCHFRHSAIP